MKLKKFHVVTMLTNPVRYKSRTRLYKKFAETMKRQGIDLWTVEVAFGQRKFVTDKNNPRNLQMRSVDELWQKESAINLLVQRFPDDWEYVAVVDADIDFIQYPCGGWLKEAWHQLQHYEVVQMWQSAIDMSHSGGVMQTHMSFMYAYLHGIPHKGTYAQYAHPGYAWAYTKKAWNGMGGLIDWAILGSGDHHIACSLIGRGADSVPSDLHPEYLKRTKAWEANALATINKDVGYLPTTIRHNFHGPKKSRGYWSRWDILKQTGFDPDLDLKRDHNGLWQLTDRNPSLRDGIRKYFRSRNEDGIDS